MYVVTRAYFHETFTVSSRISLTRTHVNCTVRSFCRPFIVQRFSERPRTDTDFWLIGVSESVSDSAVKAIMDEINLDIDDQVQECLLYEIAVKMFGRPLCQVYLYTVRGSSGGMITVREAYKIHESMEATVQAYGTWGPASGLAVPEPEIWQRRRDMKVPTR